MDTAEHARMAAHTLPLVYKVVLWSAWYERQYTVFSYGTEELAKTLKSAEHDTSVHLISVTPEFDR